MKKHLTTAWLVATTAAVVFLGYNQAVSQQREMTLEKLTVQRLDVVEKDGTPRFIVSNSTTQPGLIWGNKEFKHHSREGGGVLFFNREGDEVGGMSFDGGKTADGWRAGGGIMFDQYKQDQTVGLTYSDRNGQRQAGLRVWDRPEWNMGELLPLSDKAARAKTDEEKQAIRQEMMAFAQSKGDLGGERLFVGKSLEDSVVRLNDKQGRPRLVMKVDGKGQPSIEFLDAEGKVTRRVTELTG